MGIDEDRQSNGRKQNSYMALLTTIRARREICRLHIDVETRWNVGDESNSAMIVNKLNMPESSWQSCQHEERDVYLLFANLIGIWLIDDPVCPR